MSSELLLMLLVAAGTLRLAFFKDATIIIYKLLNKNLTKTRQNLNYNAARNFLLLKWQR